MPCGVGAVCELPLPTHCALSEAESSAALSADTSYNTTWTLKSAYTDVVGIRLTAVQNGTFYRSQHLAVYVSDSPSNLLKALCRAELTFMDPGATVTAPCPGNVTGMAVRYVTVVRSSAIGSGVALAGATIFTHGALSCALCGRCGPGGAGALLRGVLRGVLHRAYGAARGAGRMHMLCCMLRHVGMRAAAGPAV